MKILFLHGWTSVPGGVKPTFLASHGHEVINPPLPDEDFAEAVRIAQSEFDRHRPEVVVGSSRGGVAMNINASDARLVLLCPAWRRWGTANSIKPGTIILHSRADEVIPFAESRQLIANSRLGESALIEVGVDHRLADPEPLRAMLEACERPRIRLIEITIDGTPAEDLHLDELAQSVCEATAGLYRRTGFFPPWIGYLAEVQGRIVGTCAFRHAPREGRVEIAYFTFPPHEGHGIAMEMARRLIDIARFADSDTAVFARTLPEVNASTAILNKLGFRCAGSVHDPEDGEIWEWHASRD